MSTNVDTTGFLKKICGFNVFFQIVDLLKSYCWKKRIPMLLRKDSKIDMFYWKVRFLMASTLFSLIFFEIAVVSFFYSLGSRKILTGVIRL